MKPLRSRFEKDTDSKVQNYTESISYDQRLYRQDIAGSIAHAKMLASRKIITWAETEKIAEALIAIRDEIDRGEFNFDPALEDIHMNIETRLFEMVGDIAGKLHTARSRNDQVATDIRLYTRDAILESVALLRAFQNVILDLAEANKEVIIPGYTHMQRAQPILLAHHLLAYFEMAQRDVDRFEDCLKRTDVLPLGSGALAGVPYPIDRNVVMRELGFGISSANSMDAVSDRDFIIEYQADASIAMMHFSRMAEEMVLWSSAEFGYIEIDDAYATSSSIMPQKKNPDVAELARGKTGRIYGNLMAILTTMKGLPLAYNRDLQEDKEGFFDTVETLNSTIEVFIGMLKTIKFNADRTQKAAGENFTLATDVADYLAKKGMPFREAHGIVGKLVLLAISKNKDLSDLPLSDYQNLSPLFEEDVYSITIQSSIEARNVPGGTAPKQVERAFKRARRKMNE